MRPWDRITFMVAIAGWMAWSPAFGQQFIIKEGQAQAEIVIAREPTRTAKLAAAELQRFLQRISGDTLLIVTGPSVTLGFAGYEVKVFRLAG